jgi:hypothetical protein
MNIWCEVMRPESHYSVPENSVEQLGSEYSVLSTLDFIMMTPYLVPKF